MSQKFEEAIKHWYENRNSQLEYLDLAIGTKPTISHLSHNLDTTFDRLSLFASISIKNFHSLREQSITQHKEVIQNLQNQQKFQKKLLEAVLSLQKELLLAKPLTSSDVETLVLKISEQPKLIETQAVNLIEELQKQLKKTEALVEKVFTHLTT
ncbi:ORF1 [Badnavirus tessellopandani]|uniref:ORF1 n=1 Tax=Pandanus badnavirus TaxID=2975548 RepID=A0AAE9NV56_9VIRU|nr:ORF1 [Pandanus badnavirus]